MKHIFHLINFKKKINHNIPTVLRPLPLYSLSILNDRALHMDVLISLFYLESKKKH